MKELLFLLSSQHLQSLFNMQHILKECFVLLDMSIYVAEIYCLKDTQTKQLFQKPLSNMYFS